MVEDWRGNGRWRGGDKYIDYSFRKLDQGKIKVIATEGLLLYIFGIDLTRHTWSSLQYCLRTQGDPCNTQKHLCSISGCNSQRTYWYNQVEQSRCSLIKDESLWSCKGKPCGIPSSTFENSLWVHQMGGICFCSALLGIVSWKQRIPWAI